MVYFDHVACISTVGMPFFARIETIHHDYASLQKPFIDRGDCRAFMSVTLKIMAEHLEKAKAFSLQNHSRSVMALAIAPTTTLSS